MSLPKNKFNKLQFLSFASLISMFLLTSVVPQASAAAGFNSFGYNYGARIFSGSADGVDNVLDGTIWNDPRNAAYVNDHLVMKWNSAWDSCNDNGYDDPKYCAGAWTTNEWNGKVPGGSGWIEHIKIIWVGSAAAHSSYWVDGGYLVWDNYEVISDRAMDPDHVKFIFAAGKPSGLGFSK